MLIWCEDGRLQRLLSAGNDLDALRQRVSQQLLAAAEDGRLEKAMQKRSEVRAQGAGDGWGETMGKQGKWIEHMAI